MIHNITAKLKYDSFKCTQWEKMIVKEAAWVVNKIK